MPTFAPLRPADAIVVLGNRPPADEQGVPRPETRRRVEAGARAFQQQLAPLIVVSGGKTGERVEAEVMRALAIELGVPAQAILMERRSVSTITNARYSIELLRKRLSRRAVSVILVSSPYHLARAGRLFACTGAEVQLFPAKAPGSLAYRFGFTLYEYWQRILYLFIDTCAEARGEEDRPTYRGIL